MILIPVQILNSCPTALSETVFFCVTDIGVRTCGTQYSAGWSTAADLLGKTALIDDVEHTCKVAAAAAAAAAAAWSNQYLIGHLNKILHHSPPFRGQ